MICDYKATSKLVGGAINILKNDGVRQWVSDDIPYNYEMEYIQVMFRTSNQKNMSSHYIIISLKNPHILGVQAVHTKKGPSMTP